MSREEEGPDASLNQQTPSVIKTPIQLLHEYSTKTGTLPVYTMEKTVGEPHQPIFVFTVSIGDIRCTGQGSSKRAAKHQAAESALSLLQIDGALENLRMRADDASDTAAQSNSVGRMQELAVERGWRIPEYTVVTVSGPAHKREYTVSCRMESLHVSASGSSKKAAKRAAAEEMWQHLQTLSGASEITWAPRPCVRFEDLRNSSDEKISLLRTNPLGIPNTDYVRMMLELSMEQGFQVTYFDIVDLTMNCQYQCLAEMSTAPFTVCHGTGASRQHAHNDAAHIALQYIKVMTSIQ